MVLKSVIGIYIINFSNIVDGFQTIVSERKIQWQTGLTRNIPTQALAAEEERKKKDDEVSNLEKLKLTDRYIAVDPNHDQLSIERIKEKNAWNRSSHQTHMICIYGYVIKW